MLMGLNPSSIFGVTYLLKLFILHGGTLHTINLGIGIGIPVALARNCGFLSVMFRLMELSLTQMFLSFL